jgi:hypothetical protein
MVIFSNCLFDCPGDRLRQNAVFAHDLSMFRFDANETVKYFASNLH